jgi:hypothetical protein
VSALPRRDAVRYGPRLGRRAVSDGERNLGFKGPSTYPWAMNMIRHCAFGLTRIWRLTRQHSFLKTVRRKTVRRTGGIAFDKVAWFVDRIFDRRRGVDTSGVLELHQLNIDRENARHAGYYEPTPVNVLKRALAQLSIDHREFVFIDYGSGKGRELLVASRYPSAQIIGVEISQKLDQIAKRNLETWRTHAQGLSRSAPSVPRLRNTNHPTQISSLTSSCAIAKETRSARLEPKSLSHLFGSQARVYLEAKHASLIDASSAFPFKKNIGLPRILLRRPGAIKSLVLYSNQPLPPTT